MKIARFAEIATLGVVLALTPEVDAEEPQGIASPQESSGGYNIRPRKSNIEAMFS